MTRLIRTGAVRERMRYVGRDAAVGKGGWRLPSSSLFLPGSRPRGWPPQTFGATDRPCRTARRRPVLRPIAKTLVSNTAIDDGSGTAVTALSNTVCPTRAPIACDDHCLRRCVVEGEMHAVVNPAQTVFLGRGGKAGVGPHLGSRVRRDGEGVSIGAEEGGQDGGDRRAERAVAGPVGSAFTPIV